ncbi:MAG: hypothetical protein HFP76_00865 [Methylococcales symbiont of Iophon sp. n. MRB-2018]|nr:MAG: hypothetical protein HFP76_00865 [Methylococcales symbiont of Iophon sp. n. MRB-2018]
MSLCAGAIAVNDGSTFSDASRSVFLVGPDCLGNETSVSECSKHVPASCTSGGGVGVVCQGT